MVGWHFWKEAAREEPRVPRRCGAEDEGFQRLRGELIWLV